MTMMLTATRNLSSAAYHQSTIIISAEIEQDDPSILVNQSYSASVQQCNSVQFVSVLNSILRKWVQILLSYQLTVTTQLTCVVSFSSSCLLLQSLEDFSSVCVCLARCVCVCGCACVLCNGVILHLVTCCSYNTKAPELPSYFHHHRIHKPLM